MRFRTGRKVGRTIYVQRGDQADVTDPLIGMLDTPELARFAVAAMNAALDRGEEPPEVSR